MREEELIALLASFLIGGWLLRPVVHAFADRLRGRTTDPLRAEVQAMRDDLLGEIQDVKRDVGELAERVDFTERLLAGQRPSALPPKDG